MYELNKRTNLKPGKSKAFSFTVDVPIEWLTGGLKWQGGAGSFDPELRGQVQIIRPDGTVGTYDSEDLASELRFQDGGPAGRWTVVVHNIGTKRLRARISFAAGSNADR